MDNSFHQQGSETQQSSGLLASLQIINRILSWLTSLFKLTEDEQKEAGVYLRDQRYE